MQRKRFLTVILAAIIMVFSACNEALDISALISDENKNISELLTHTYSSEQLKEIIIFTNLEQVNEEYPIECLRKKDFGYRAVFKGDKTVMLVDFDDNGLRIDAETVDIIKDSGFDGLNIGDSVRNVRELDPAGEYAFLYTGDSSLPRESYHYLDTGYVFHITYDSGNVITDIEKSML